MRAWRLAVGFGVLAALLARPGEGAGADPAVDAARAFRQAHGAEILRSFAELLALPNVASDLPGIERNALFIREALAARGARTELWRQDGVPPIVFGELPAPGAARTLGVYMHYDGQPVVAADWAQDPWQPTLYDGALEAGGRPRPLPVPGEPIDPEWRLYGRGAGDDKAPLPAILAALDALEAAGIPRTVNLKFFFEGEEEEGSGHLEAYMREHRERLDVDLWLVCDGPVHQSRRPQLVFGVRGITALDVTVYGASRYLHSGHYGNWSPNPALLLSQLLASMKDADGDVVIAGFYDDTIPPGPAERAALAALPAVEEGLLRELELAPGATDGAGATLAERLLLPSLNVRGLVSGAVGAGARNVIPTQAEASLDVRLVKGNDPQRMLDVVEAHIASHGFHVVRETPDAATRRAHPRIAKVVREGGYPAARTPLDAAAVQPAIAAARRVAGDELILMPSLGGSLPLYLFADILGSPVVIVPIANHDDNQHAPNENLRLANLWYGIELMAALFTSGG
ncbi:MAG: M20/M25/M40 family metallo-hydrolase [Acidobacteriota bacterium]|nr:M20/M25/M40 family metallo-hydrolase [Acidobacteriota bacterium]